ncbi:MAG: glycine cleavage system protein H [Eubacteriales bacterium]|nr:glycine cleavage system protein H [Eubacteriales bacterium]
MSELFFTLQHEWVRFNNNKAFVGLTGRGIPGDIVFIELPQIGQQVLKGEPCATVESVKSVIEVHAPAAGTVSGINDTVFDDPDAIVKYPQKTWLFKVDYEGDADKAGLLTEEEYKAL